MGNVRQALLRGACSSEVFQPRGVEYCKFTGQCAYCVVVWFRVKGWFQGLVKEFTSAGFLSAGAEVLLWAPRAVFVGRLSGVSWARGHVVYGAANA